ncbi:3-oxoacyl-[acyl-carrier-protein] synthase-3 [Serratia fonticola]|uniref:3-oxoacyl-[acyl-carrier-protein] synthase-3 n=1 Tax=Serratia fonticola TaxID=47917 RepID=A0A559TA09_SERFO|nr:3-oxoacyl-[acyl-carrier-protein] synthase III C-terminal domain-containing protein [Serratia fonticola]TQI81024.1 3-oxoacyl-[acyl-carrier-protein] synthase-3 [Serratia fonticola]TQI96952.1 3-oxoacyl-[acyl-carrier-protein] synthase-3 [Serratia fonticola]TVZ71447.1 3-oxoacyl-[acyl-carrier-protein] synthase-3 [Serratia fonticola]
MTIDSLSHQVVPIKIIATGAALPSLCIASSVLDQQLNKPTGYVEKRSGIIHRFHAAHDASQAELAVAALDDALDRHAIPRDSIDLLISASAIAVQALPFSAAHILKLAGLRRGIAGFDINTSCVSFISALQVAAGLLNSGIYRRIAIVSADIASRGIDWQDEESSLIFGDGAACAIVERGDGQSGILSYLMETYPEGSELCEIRAGGTRCNPRAGMKDSDFLFHMKGKQLFRQASALIESFLSRLLAAGGLTLAQIATVVPHQASHLSLEHMRRRLHVAPEALVDIYRYRGNQVAASIPSALHEAAITGRLNAEKPVMLIGTAAGLTLGGMVLLP